MKTHYFWDPFEDNVIEEFDDDGDTIVEYTTEPDLHGNVISQLCDGVTSTFHYDGLGSTIAVTNDAGDVTDTLAYSAFGSVTRRTGATEFPFHFIGKKGYYFDPVNGDYYVRRRLYQPSIARWMSVDPLSHFGLDPYRYVGNRATYARDPTGLYFSWKEVVDGQWAQYEITTGHETPGTPLFEYFDVYPSGRWGQAASKTSGSIDLSWGAKTTVNLTGGNVCNSIIDNFLGKELNTIDSGVIRAQVEVPTGSWEILWLWEVKASGNAVSGKAKITAPHGTKGKGNEVLKPTLLPPGFHASGLEKSTITNNNPWWHFSQWYAIAIYDPTLARSGATNLPGSDGNLAQSSATGSIKILKIKKVVDK